LYTDIAFSDFLNKNFIDDKGGNEPWIFSLNSQEAIYCSLDLNMVINLGKVRELDKECAPSNYGL
jgi:hypothetical protein